MVLFVFVVCVVGVVFFDGIRCSDEAINGVEIIFDKKLMMFYECLLFFFGLCEDIVEFVLCGDVC